MALCQKKAWVWLLGVGACLAVGGVVPAAMGEERATVLGERTENFALAESTTVAPVDLGFGLVSASPLNTELGGIGIGERNGFELSATVYFPGPFEWLFKGAVLQGNHVESLDEASKLYSTLNTLTLYTGPALTAVMFTHGDQFLSGSIGGGPLLRNYAVTIHDEYVTREDKGWGGGAFAEASLRYHAFTKLVFGGRLWAERAMMKLNEVADRQVTDDTYSTALEVAFAL